LTARGDSRFCHACLLALPGLYLVLLRYRAWHLFYDILFSAEHLQHARRTFWAAHALSPNATPPLVSGRQRTPNLPAA